MVLLTASLQGRNVLDCFHLFHSLFILQYTSRFFPLFHLLFSVFLVSFCFGQASACNSCFVGRWCPTRTWNFEPIQRGEGRAAACSGGGWKGFSLLHNFLVRWMALRARCLDRSCCPIASNLCMQANPTSGAWCGSLHYPDSFPQTTEFDAERNLVTAGSTSIAVY